MEDRQPLAAQPDHRPLVVPRAWRRCSAARGSSGTYSASWETRRLRTLGAPGCCLVHCVGELTNCGGYVLGQTQMGLTLDDDQLTDGPETAPSQQFR